MKPNNCKLLRADQVAKRLNCCTRLIYKLIDRGDLEAICIGRGNKGIRIFETSLDLFIEVRKKDPLANKIPTNRSLKSHTESEIFGT